MCGVAGVLVRRGSLSDDALDSLLERMIAPITHRGPDDAGRWGDAAAGIGLGFRRLAILDLSEAGHQPMRSSTGRYTMVFNGEIYNYRDLSKELEARGARWRGHSDSEVILAAFEQWGVDAAVRRLIGMFAIAVWDAQAGRLSLVRDQLGIKPLYVYAKAASSRSPPSSRPSALRPTSIRRSIASRSRRICATCTCRPPGRSFDTSSSCLPAISCTSPIRRRPCPRP